MLEKLTAVAYAITALIGALAMLAGLLANVLPEGKLKTAMSYAGTRLLKAHQVAKGALPEVAKAETKDGAK